MNTVSMWSLLLMPGFLFTSTVQPVAGQAERLNATVKKDSPADQADEKKSNVIRIFNGKDLKGLRILKEGYFDEHGKIEVDKGILIVGKGMPGSGVAVNPNVLKKSPRINYEIRLQAKRIEGGDFFCGLTFPIEKSYCTLILGGWGGGAIGLSNVDTLSAIENETTNFHEFEDNQWYDIRLVVTDKRIEAFLKPAGSKKEKKLFSVATKEHKYNIWWEQEPARPLGITTWSTTAAFRKIEWIERPAVPKK